MQKLKAEKRAVEYAENRLKVHEVYDLAVNAVSNLRHFQKNANEFADAKRKAQEQMAEREMLVVSDERAANPEMSQAAFDRHIKGVLQGDPTMERIRHEIIDLQFKQDEALSMVAVNKADVEILTARMHELGGLLVFYAATKGSGGSVDSG